MAAIAIDRAAAKPPINKKSYGYYQEVRGNKPNRDFARMSPNAGKN